MPRFSRGFLFGGTLTLAAPITRLSLGRALLAGAALLLLYAREARSQAQTQPPPAPSAAQPARVEVTDEAGRRVSVPALAQRIVSLAPSLTETLYALDAQERVVGVTDFCDFPPEAKQKQRVGGPVNPSLEQIVALKPDLVLATKSLNRRETVDALEQLGVPVYATAPATVEDVIRSVQRLSELIGAPRDGETLAAGLRARLENLKRLLQGRTARRVLFVVWADPLITIGRKTFLADALGYAGADSIVDVPQEWPRLSLEEVVRLQPEYLVFADSHSESPEARAAQLIERPGWRGLDAVRARRVAVVSDALTRPAPRMVDAIEQLARQLHPAAFEQKTENGDREGKAGSRGSQFPFSLFRFPSPAEAP
jgi:iron complex transport system substrate-binding protein